MDNITHTLVGVLVGEAVARGPAACDPAPGADQPGASRPASGLAGGVRRSLIVTAFAVSSNLPDADLLYTSFASGPLVYLLQHRGYTHTVPGALVLALLLYLACEGWLKWRGLKPSTADRGWIAGSALLGVLLHLAMDYTNSYGVHPFWPFHDGWLYGDSVFIVEPLVWIAAAPLVFLARTGIARRVIAVILSLGTVAVVVSGFVPWPAAVVFVALLLASLAAGRWLRPRAALVAGVLIWLGVTAVFVTASHAAGRRVDAVARAEFPQAVTLDHVLTPMPADPLCWDLLLVQTEGGRYLVRTARLSLAPAWIAAGQCRGVGRLTPGGGNTGAGEAAVTEHGRLIAGDAGIQWLQQFSMPVGRIAGLAAQHCLARAFMQFARVPWAAAAGPGWTLGDLRFGNGPGFSQLRLGQAAETCTFAPVPWLPPRPELLQQAGSRQADDVRPQ